MENGKPRLNPEQEYILYLSAYLWMCSKNQSDTYPYGFLDINTRELTIMSLAAHYATTGKHPASRAYFEKELSRFLENQ